MRLTIRQKLILAESSARLSEAATLVESLVPDSQAMASRMIEVFDSAANPDDNCIQGYNNDSFKKGP